MEVPTAMGRPKAVLVLDAELREQLETLVNSRSLPAGLVRRAKIILLSASGKTNREIARQLETSKVTVSLWRCRFLKHGMIEKNLPKDLEVHIIVDNYATHKHLRVRRWFATRPRFHVHYTPTYSSWLNQVEIWFNRITQQAIRRGIFSSVKDLVEKIDHYVQNSNRHARPFVWTATADSILGKVERICKGISGTTP
jgi:hypothetical protein